MFLSDGRVFGRFGKRTKYKTLSTLAIGKNGKELVVLERLPWGRTEMFSGIFAVVQGHIRKGEKLVASWDSKGELAEASRRFQRCPLGGVWLYNF